MSILRDPSDWERLNGEPLEPSVEHEAVRPSLARLGHGSFACPSCDVPLLPAGTISISAPVECPFCGGVHTARQYVRIDEIDTAYNQVSLRARLPY